MSPANLGSVQIIQRLVRGAMPGVPRIGLEVVDVRDEIELHLLAMTSPQAEGERFLGTGEFVWMREMATAIKDGLGEASRRVRTRQLPDFVVRLASLRDTPLKQIMPGLGRRSVHRTEKARRMLGWQPRPAAEVVVDSARDLIQWGLV